MSTAIAFPNNNNTTFLTHRPSTTTPAPLFAK